MKWLQIISISLTFLFFGHVATTVCANVKFFSYLKANGRDVFVNSMGKSFLRIIPEIEIPKLMKHYSSFTGTCRSYAFFSPNIRNVKREFLIKRDGMDIHPMRTFETNLKLNTLSTNLIDIVKNEEVRKEIIKGLFIRKLCISLDL